MRYFIRTVSDPISGGLIQYKAVGADDKIEITKWGRGYDPIEISGSDHDTEADGWEEITKNVFLVVYHEARESEKSRIEAIENIMKEGDNA